jgi:hypothetical protein
MRTLLTALILACLSTVAGAESPADGKWTFTMSSPMGAVDATVALKAEGEKLTGTFDLGGGRVWSVEDGTITGNDIAFVLKRDRPSGGSMSYDMKGTIKGDTIAGNATAMGSTVEWSMARPK